MEFHVVSCIGHASRGAKLLICCSNGRRFYMDKFEMNFYIDGKLKIYSRFFVMLSQTSDDRDRLRETLGRLLDEADPSVELRKPEKTSKSYAWDGDCFLMVYHNNVKQSFVFCKMCSNLITYNSVHGTGSLLRHICFRRSLNHSGASELKTLNQDATPAKVRKEHASTSASGSNPSSASKGTDLTKIKKDIEERIAMKDPSIVLQSPLNIKSEIWASGNFRTIYQNGVKLDFVMCLLCKSLITYRSKTGTASLLRHSCMRGMHTPNRNRNQTTIIKLDEATLVNAKVIPHHEAEIETEIETEMVDQEDGPKFFEVEEMPINISSARTEQDTEYYFDLTDEYKEEVAKWWHCFIYADMHPASVVNRRGFQDFAQNLINLGAEYGKVNIASVLENRNVSSLGDSFVNILNNTMKNIFDDQKVALSCDIWTDANRKTNFLTVYGHFIDVQYVMRKVNLGTEAFPLESTNFNYKELFDSILVQYFASFDDLHTFLSKSTIVMPNNLMPHFRNYSTISCSCWSLNAIVQNLLNQPIFQYLVPEELRIKENWSGVLDYLATVDKTAESNFTKLMNILNLFKMASSRMSIDDNPSINEVCLLKRKLEDHFDKLGDKTTADIAHQLFDEHFKVTNLHKIATFLDPRFKSLKFMTSDEKANVISMISKMISSEDLNAQLLQEQQDSKLPASSTTVASSSSMKPKTPKAEIIDCSDSAKYLIEYMDINEDHDDTHDEIDTYMNLKYNEIHSENILEFWESRYELPRLRQLAKEILSIPASCVTTEKIFSDDAITFSKRRLNIEIDNIKKMLFVHENYDMLSSGL